ncbi:MAG: hypothetical protein ABIU29_06495 [Chthoniobacterales bacterium]
MNPRLFRRALLPLLVLALLAGHAEADDAKSIKGFREAIIALSSTVDPKEAALVSEISHVTARRLQKEWRVVPPANFQNFLIHIGKRQRGFCFHWAHDIGAELRKLPLKTLELQWAEAYPNTRLEHNVVVVTGRDQPLGSGYIIDGWRATGRLLWWPVRKDEYPWKNNEAETAWLQKRGTDPLKALDEPLQQADSRNKTTRKSAERSL